MARLPTDDLKLEMEEVEGLVGIRSNYPPNRPNNGTCALLVRGIGRRSCVKNTSKTKWCSMIAFVGIILIILYLGDSEEMSTIEAELDQHTKNHSKVTSPTVSDGHIIGGSSGNEPNPTDEVHDTVDSKNKKKNPNDDPNDQQQPKKKSKEKAKKETKDKADTQSKDTKDPKSKDKTSETANANKEKTSDEKESPSNNEKDQEKAEKKPKKSDKDSKADTSSSEKGKVTPSSSFSPKDDEGLYPSNEKDFFTKYPNRDIPNDQWPKEAWQQQKDSVNKFLENGLKLVNRAMEAILAEYGHDQADKSFQERMEMFEVEFVDSVSKMKGNDGGDKGGFTTRRSFDGLIRRLLHAVMTGDTFTAVLGGHSAAAGHGNYFKQSYMMQFHEVMKPIFERLGVKLVTRNLAQGGLGTIQSALASGPIYGDEIDLLVWDSGMTEGRDTKAIDLFWRQALIAGKKVPIMFGAQPNVMGSLHENMDADFLFYGTGMSGIPTVESESQAQTIPFAARYMKCTSEALELCNMVENRFRGVCWIDRPDVKPPVSQNDHMGSQVKWHPGFRFHRLQGRVFSFIVLQALQEALTKWSEADGQKLKDDDWHVTDYYDNIRNKVKSSKEGPCYEYEGQISTRFCNTPMKGATSFTPRANPEENDLLSLIQPDADGYVPHVETKMVYDGPDVHNPNFDTPEGEVDVIKLITGNKRQLKENTSVVLSENDDQAEKENMWIGSNLRGNTRNLDTPIVVGKGWEAVDVPPGRCGGEYDDICGREPDDKCLLQGHHDRRGGVVGNEYSGWLVLNLNKVKEGIVVLKIETWHLPRESTRTKDWKTVNNEKSTRTLKEQAPDYPDTFHFDFAINGKITTWTKDQFLEKDQVIQRVVEVFNVLDDPNFTNGEEQDVEVAFRLRGSGNLRVFKLTHVYWA